MKKFLFAAASLIALQSLSACNTIEGIGKDVKAGGEVVEETARDVKEEIKN